LNNRLKNHLERRLLLLLEILLRLANQRECHGTAFQGLAQIFYLDVCFLKKEI
jgi:hypothetical protein